MFLEELDTTLLARNNYYERHAKVFKFNDEQTGLIGFIAIHRLRSDQPSFGATRAYEYFSEKEALNDVLKLSRLMSYKSAIANLPYGGAKAVILANGEWKKNKKVLLKKYAEVINELGGIFITGSDVGLSQADVIGMKDISNYFVGVRNDPTYFTALGLYYSFLVSLEEIFGTSNLKNRHIAIQGVGKVGLMLLDMLYKHGAKIYVSDIDNSKLEIVKTKYPNTTIVHPNQIFDLNVDVFSPCALGNCINSDTVNKLKAKIIVGGANNQLEKNNLAQDLHNKKILYCPDYLVNAGGLISVADEFKNNKLDVTSISKSIARIPSVLRKVISESLNHNKPTTIIVDKISEEIFNSYI